MEGLFEIAPTQMSELRWAGELPIESRPWNIGLIAGPSGAGKSTLVRELFPDKLISGDDWSPDKSIVDDFPKEMGIKQITALLSQVGFSSPPSWLRPYRHLSNGEQFRVTLARAMAENSDLFVIDEFTSVVDRTVAQIGSAALAKAIRQSDRRMIAVSVHYDVLPWLQPDWTYEPHINRFQWRELRQRPPIELEIVRCHRSAWQLFSRYHYLDTKLHNAAHCFVALYNGQPVAFTAVLHFPHSVQSRWREHRTVCLPDFQGVGIGNAMSDYVASLFKATGKPYSSVTSNPAMIRHRAMSTLWNMRETPKLQPAIGKTSSVKGMTSASSRLTASFDYMGAARVEDAIQFGVINARTPTKTDQIEAVSR
jgi:ABC-type arginine transport system ATPase subunit